MSVSPPCERGTAHSEHQPRQRVGFVKGGLHSIQTGNINYQSHRNGDTLVFDFCAIAKIINPTFAKPHPLPRDFELLGAYIYDTVHIRYSTRHGVANDRHTYTYTVHRLTQMQRQTDRQTDRHTDRERERERERPERELYRFVLCLSA